MESVWGLIVLYKMENIFKNKIINGDSLEELKKIPSGTFDLVFADPPYNLQLKTYLQDLIELKSVQSMINGINLKASKNMMNLQLLGFQNAKEF